MRHADFRIGAEFRCGGRLWRCTDIGTRIIVAIRIDRVEVGGSPPLRRTLSGAEAEAKVCRAASSIIHGARVAWPMALPRPRRARAPQDEAIAQALGLGRPTLSESESK